MAWYHNPEGRNRLIKESELLHQKFPSFTLKVPRDGSEVVVNGWLGPDNSNVLTFSYHVIGVYPQNYGTGSRIRFYVIDPPSFPEGTPHLYTDGEICLDHNGSFTHKSTVVTSLGWVVCWLGLFERWLTKGKLW